MELEANMTEKIRIPLGSANTTDYYGTTHINEISAVIVGDETYLEQRKGFETIEMAGYKRTKRYLLMLNPDEKLALMGGFTRGVVHIFANFLLGAGRFWR